VNLVYCDGAVSVVVDAVSIDVLARLGHPREQEGSKPRK